MVQGPLCILLVNNVSIPIIDLLCIGLCVTLFLCLLEANGELRVIGAFST